MSALWEDLGLNSNPVSKLEFLVAGALTQHVYLLEGSRIAR